jgi:hypothetical protein
MNRGALNGTNAFVRRFLKMHLINDGKRVLKRLPAFCPYNSGKGRKVTVEENELNNTI